MNLLYAAGFGFFGGMIRALIGIMKLSKVNLKFNWSYFISSLVASGFIGMFAGLLVNSDYRLTLLAGYAGLDLIEGVYKAQKARLK